MSFETAKPVTPESFSQNFEFMRRPAVRYPLKGEVKQSVNISQDARARAATRSLKSPYAPKLSYAPTGLFSQSVPVGQHLSSFA